MHSFWASERKSIHTFKKPAQSQFWPTYNSHICQIDFRRLEIYTWYRNHSLRYKTREHFTKTSDYLVTEDNRFWNMLSWKLLQLHLCTESVLQGPWDNPRMSFQLPSWCLVPRSTTHWALYRIPNFQRRGRVWSAFINSVNYRRSSVYFA